MRSNVTRWDVKLKIIVGILFGLILSMIWDYFIIIRSNVNPASSDGVSFWVQLGFILVLFIFGLFLSCFLFFRTSHDKYEINQYNLALKAFIGGLIGFLVWLAIAAIANMLQIKMNNLINGVGGCITILVIIIILWLYPKNSLKIN